MSDAAMTPFVKLTGLTRSFEQGGERIDVLRGINLRSLRCSAPLARANRPCCKRSACSKAGSGV